MKQWSSDEFERRLDAALARLPRYGPAPGFADRVMARVQLPARAVRYIVGHSSLWAWAAGLAAISLASTGTAVLWILNHRAVAATFAGHISDEVAAWSAGVYDAMAARVASLPWAEIVATIGQYGPQALLVSLASVALYVGGCVWLWNLLRSPAGAYVPSR